MTLDRLAGVLGRRSYDLRRRTLNPLLAAGVVECCSGEYRLVDEWRYALDKRREQDGEIAAAEKQRLDHEREREAFAYAWRRGEVVSRQEFARRRRDRDRIRPEERHPFGTIEELAPVPDVDPVLLEILPAAVERFPRRLKKHPTLREYASWLAGTIWAYCLLEDKPTPEQVEAALHELQAVAA